ncbi:MAG: hypothetical protein LR011_12410 [Verrucomicrobia bacterium]|nr:hypothetical protein [Verrucomicrobiota bacterium]
MSTGSTSAGSGSRTFPGLRNWIRHVLLLTIAAIQMNARSQPADWIQPGHPFPDISLPDITGKGSISFPPRNGRPTLIHLFASW